MQLHQIQLRYVAVEDRALLRIATRQPPDTASEFRFWMTRKYAALLLSALSRKALGAAKAGPGARPGALAQKQSAVLAFEHESALASSDFETAYAPEEPATPLGESPVLLARIGVSRHEGGITVLAMHPAKGQGIEIRLNDKLVHSLIRLVEDAARSGGWDLPPTLPASLGVSGSERMN